jgi:hypothetical protein
VRFCASEKERFSSDLARILCQRWSVSMRPTKFSSRPGAWRPIIESPQSLKHLSKYARRIIATALAPRDQLRHVDSAVGRFAVVDPRLRFAKFRAQSPLCQPGRFPDLPEQRRNDPVGGAVLGLGHRPALSGSQTLTRNQCQSNNAEQALWASRHWPVVLRWD